MTQADPLGTTPAMWRNQLAIWGPRLAAPLFDSALWRLPERSRRERQLSLTFDDGPTAGTAAVLDVLDRYAIPATFFVVGQAVARDPQRLRAIRQAGHAIGNHSDTHRDAWRLDTPELLADFDRQRLRLEDLLGETVPWMRPPFGHFTRPLIRWCRAHGQRMVMWDAMTPDFDLRVPLGSLERRLSTAIRPGSIVLLHDHDRAATVTGRLLAEWLPRRLDEGWQFVGLPEECRFARHAA